MWGGLVYASMPSIFQNFININDNLNWLILDGDCCANIVVKLALDTMSLKPHQQLYKVTWVDIYAYFISQHKLHGLISMHILLANVVLCLSSSRLTLITCDDHTHLVRCAITIWPWCMKLWKIQYTCIYAQSRKAYWSHCNSKCRKKRDGASPPYQNEISSYGE